jgi:cell shape-determining protein MreC
MWGRGMGSDRMPVVTGGAVLIGRVARVSPNLAYVQLSTTAK